VGSWLVPRAQPCAAPPTVERGAGSSLAAAGIPSSLGTAVPGEQRGADVSRSVAAIECSAGVWLLLLSVQVVLKTL